MSCAVKPPNSGSSPMAPLLSLSFGVLMVVPCLEPAQPSSHSLVLKFYPWLKYQWELQPQPRGRDTGLNFNPVFSQGTSLPILLGDEQPSPVQWQMRSGSVCLQPLLLDLWAPRIAAALLAGWLFFFQGLGMLLTLPCSPRESGGVDPACWSSLPKSGDLPGYVVTVGKHSPAELLNIKGCSQSIPCTLMEMTEDKEENWQMEISIKNISLGQWAWCAEQLPEADGCFGEVTVNLWRLFKIVDVFSLFFWG